MVLGGLLVAATPSAAEEAWVTESNRIALSVIAGEGRFFPEQASEFGVEPFDTAVTDFGPDYDERFQAEAEKLIAGLKQDRDSAADPHLRQDVDIMIDFEQRNLDSDRLHNQLLLEYLDLPELVYRGLQVLLEPRNKPERQIKALERAKLYAGMTPGATPLTELAKARMLEAIQKPGRVGPYAEDLKQRFDNTEFFITGIAELFAKTKIEGWQPVHQVLAEQLRAYRDWARQSVLPLERAEARPPAAIYADSLKLVGVPLSPDELIERSSADYQELRDEAQLVANRVAAQRHLPSADFRDVLRSLRSHPVPPAAMLELYRRHLAAIEAIIRKEKIVTLPKRAANIRLATDAEAANTPSPFMSAPRLIGNTGEFGEFIIPLGNPHAKSTEKMDDFANDGEAWTLTAHEARPGHELQFASMVEHGVSLARGIFAFNSANVEGWALYCESLIYPYMPPEGQLFGLQDRMLRMARAFLDPMVNLGRITPEQAKRFLIDELAESEPTAQQEADRYAFRDPGQATSYYYGYIRLRGLRTQTELALGKKFNLQAFNDFILTQGLVPPGVLSQAVTEQFVPAMMGRAGP
jgi:hypothetical protein